MPFQQESHVAVIAGPRHLPAPNQHPAAGTTADWDFGRYAPASASRLYAGPAHDLNSMLTAILGFVQLGRMRGAEDPEGLQEDLEAIDVAARRAVHLVRELVIAEQKGRGPGHNNADPNECIEELAPVLRRIVAPCEIQLDLHNDAPRAEIPREALARVIFNLVLNAREAMPKGGRIRISTRRVPVTTGAQIGSASHELQLSVNDTGVGMDSATLARIFDADFTTKTPGRGNGLGLCTVRDVLQQARGRATVTTAPGRGTTFIVHLAAIRGCSA